MSDQSEQSATEPEKVWPEKFQLELTEGNAARLNEQLGRFEVCEYDKVRGLRGEDGVVHVIADGVPVEMDMTDVLVPRAQKRAEQMRVSLARMTDEQARAGQARVQQALDKFNAERAP